MFGFHVYRRNNSATLAYGVEQYLPFELRTRLVKQHMQVSFIPENGGYIVSMCYWKREDLLDEESPFGFDAFYEQWQDTRSLVYDPAMGEHRWKV